MFGSPIWRIRNYGLIPSVRYFAHGRLGSKSQNRNLDSLSFAQFAKLLGLDDINPEFSSRFAVEEQMDAMRSIHTARVVGQDIKDVLRLNASISRLIVLELSIRSKKFNSFIETGTQHGLSAFVVGETAHKHSPRMKLTSFDVSHDQYFVKSAAVEYILLKSPIRKNFKKISIEGNFDNAIFFHDSDHSYENMRFEFQWAWNYLKVNLIISDDIDGNNAFYDFCKKNRIKGYRIKLDQGPAVGVVIRGGQ